MVYIPELSKVNAISLRKMQITCDDQATLENIKKYSKLMPSLEHQDRGTEEAAARVHSLPTAL